MREFSVKFPAEQNLPLKNFLGTSSRVPLFCAAMPDCTKKMLPPPEANKKNCAPSPPGQ